MGHILTENRNGLVVDVRVTQATGRAEREAAAEMLKGKPASKWATLRADRGYDTAGLVKQMREMKVTPHVAQNDSHRRSAIDARTTRHEYKRSVEAEFAVADMEITAGRVHEIAPQDLRVVRQSVMAGETMY